MKVARMIHHPLVLLVVLLATNGVSSDASAQGRCAMGTPDTTTVLVQRWVVPHEPHRVRALVRLAVERSGLRFERSESGSAEMRTAPSFRWLPHSIFTLWRGLSHPGIVVEAVVVPVETWSEITLRSYAICRTGQKPPPSWSQDVNVEYFVAGQTLSVVEGNLYPEIERLPVVAGRDCAPLRDGDHKILVCMAVVERRRDDPEAWRNLALALIRFHKVPAAKEPIDMLFWLEGDRVENYLAIAEAMMDARARDLAEEYLGRALRLWPEHSGLHLLSGTVMREQGRIREGIAQFRRAKELDSANAFARYELAVTLHRTRRRVEARAECRQVFDHLRSAEHDQTDDLRTLTALAYCAALLGEHRDAVTYFARAHALSRSYVFARRDLVQEVHHSYAALGEKPPMPVPPSP